MIDQKKFDKTSLMGYAQYGLDICTQGLFFLEGYESFQEALEHIPDPAWFQDIVNKLGINTDWLMHAVLLASEKLDIFPRELRRFCSETREILQEITKKSPLYGPGSHIPDSYQRHLRAYDGPDPYGLIEALGDTWPISFNFSTFLSITRAADVDPREVCKIFADLEAYMPSELVKKLWDDLDAQIKINSSIDYRKLKGLFGKALSFDLKRYYEENPDRPLSYEGQVMYHLENPLTFNRMIIVLKLNKQGSLSAQKLPTALVELGGEMISLPVNYLYPIGTLTGKPLEDKNGVE